jgi:hypothetical protein
MGSTGVVNLDHSEHLLYDQLHQIAQGELTMANLTTCTIQLMQAVQENRISGGSKKHKVLRVLNVFIDQQVSDFETKLNLKALVACLLPKLIDDVVAVARSSSFAKAPECRCVLS